MLHWTWVRTPCSPRKTYRQDLTSSRRVDDIRLTAAIDIQCSPIRPRGREYGNWALCVEIQTKASFALLEDPRCISSRNRIQCSIDKTKPCCRCKILLQLIGLGCKFLELYYVCVKRLCMLDKGETAGPRFEGTKIAISEWSITCKCKHSPTQYEHEACHQTSTV